MQMSDSQLFTASIKPVDKKGNPALVDGVPQWFTDNTDVLALTPSADGLNCQIAAVGPLGSAKVSVKADAKIGEGVTDIVGVLDVEITAGEATTVEIVPGPLSEQP